MTTTSLFSRPPVAPAPSPTPTTGPSAVSATAAIATTPSTTTRPTDGGAARSPDRSIRGSVHLAWDDPLTLLVAVVVGAGAWLFVVDQVVPSIQAYATAVVLSFALWSAFAVAWLFFIRRRQLFAQLPRGAAAVGFLWGGMAATWVMALRANDAVLSLLTKLVSPWYASTWGAATSAPFVEELSKGLGVVVVLVLIGQRLRSPFQTMVAGAFVGIGFQVFEDWLYSVGAAAGAFGQDQPLHVVQSFLMRCFVAGFWSHAMFTALVGAGIGFLVSRDAPRKVGVAVGCIAAAPFLHWLWDSPLLDGLGVVGLLIKAVPAVVIYVLVYRAAVRTEQAWVEEALDPLVDAGVVPADDVRSLAPTVHGRRKHGRALARQHGHRFGRRARTIERAERRYQRALTDLAAALDDAQHDVAAPVTSLRDAADRARAERDLVVRAA